LAKRKLEEKKQELLNRYKVYLDYITFDDYVEEDNSEGSLPWHSEPSSFASSLESSNQSQSGIENESCQESDENNDEKSCDDFRGSLAASSNTNSTLGETLISDTAKNCTTNSEIRANLHLLLGRPSVSVLNDFSPIEFEADIGSDETPTSSSVSETSGTQVHSKRNRSFSNSSSNSNNFSPNKKTKIEFETGERGNNDSGLAFSSNEIVSSFQNNPLFNIFKQ
jgi:hypothetical protein